MATAARYSRAIKDLSLKTVKNKLTDGLEEPANPPKVLKPQGPKGPKGPKVTDNP